MIFADEYDLGARQSLRADFERLLDVNDVVLDLTDVTYIDSAFVHELMRMHDGRSSKGYQRETIVTENDNLRKIFRILDIERVFRFVARLEEVAKLDGQPAELHYARSGE